MGNRPRSAISAQWTSRRAILGLRSVGRRKIQDPHLIPFACLYAWGFVREDFYLRSVRQEFCVLASRRPGRNKHIQDNYANLKSFAADSGTFGMSPRLLAVLEVPRRKANPVESLYLFKTSYKQWPVEVLWGWLQPPKHRKAVVV